MPKALKKTCDRQRKEKYTNEELVMLTQTLAEHAEVVFANDMRRATLLKKKAIWEEVAVKVSAVGTSTRTVRECRKRWDDLRLRVRGILAENHRIASAGGDGSPIRLKEWEETCANMIATESIEGVGSMEVGVATTSDAGSHTDGEDAADASKAPPTSKRPRAQEPEETPATSRGKGGRPHLKSGSLRHSATARAAVAAPPTVAPPPEANPLSTMPDTQGPPSAAASSAGEAAATGPQSDPEDTLLQHMEMHTPSPPGSPEPVASQTPGSDGTYEDTNPAIMSPMLPSPVALEPSEGTASNARSPGTDHQFTAILQRQQELTVLVGQHVAEAANLTEKIVQTARHSTERMDANTDRICNEIASLREVLVRMADTMDCHFHPQGQSAPSSTSGSTQTSPLRRSMRTTRRTSGNPQDPSKDNCN